MDLETILRKHFNCSNPFLKKPKAKHDNPNGSEITGYEYLTVTGNRAYEKLTSLLYDLGALLENFDANAIIEELDRIVDSPAY